MSQLQSGLRTGLALGQSFAQGQQRRSAEQALTQAAQQLQSGVPFEQVLQQVQSESPEAAAQLLNMRTAQQQQQQNQMTIDQQQRERGALDEISGDSQIIKLFKKSPELAGQLVNIQRTVKPEHRLGVGLPLIGALRIRGNDKAKQNLIAEAATDLEKFSPQLAENLREIQGLSGDELDQGIAGTVMAMREIGFLPQDPERAGESDKTAQQKNLEVYRKLAQEDPEMAERFAQSANLNPNERVQMGITETRGKETAKQQVERQGEAIGKGLRQAGAIGGIDRALELLDVVGTGGYASAKKYVTDFLGTTPADEAEFAYLTGKNVLGQLKDTFGAQFTNEEAKRLERLEAGLGRSTEANRAILERARETAISAAKRAYEAARQQGDEFTASGIARDLRAAGIDVQSGRLGSGEPKQKTAEDYIREAQQGQ